MSGLLGKAAMNATPVRVSRVNGDATKDGAISVNILVLNDTASDVDARVWISSSDSAPSNGDIVAPKLIIPAYGTAEVSARLCSPGEYVYVQAAAGCYARVEGTPFEEGV